MHKKTSPFPPAGGLIILFLLLFSTGCDTAPGPTDSNQKAPVLTNFTLSPDTVIFENLTVDGSGRVNFEVSFSARIQDANGDISSVNYIIQSPYEEEPIATGLLDYVGLAPKVPSLGTNGYYQGSPTLSLTRSVPGPYTIRLYATDENQNLSNEVSGQVQYVVLTNNPPAIDTLIANPDTVSIPAAGETALFQVIAGVSDPDGLENVAKVELETASGATFTLLDDGQPGSGDQTADDGFFTVTFQIDSNTPAGVSTFTVTASDRQGLNSTPMTIDIVFQ